MFVEKFSADFIDKWNIILEDGSTLVLQLNKNYYNPTLISGWSDIKNLYSFPNNVEVTFAYYGMNIFKVTMFNEVTCTSQIPIFHSRSTKANETKCFDIRLFGNDLKRNNLVGII